MQTIKSIEEKQDLYRHFDKDGVLLYVGRSVNAATRLLGHKRQSGWYDDITTITIEKFDSLEEVIKAEKKAIATENPMYNRTIQKTEDMSEKVKMKSQHSYHTQYVGVIYRKNKKKTYKGKPDRYYIIRYKYKNKSVSEAVGWLSAGVTAEYAATIRGKIVQNIREGKYPKSLSQMRELSENGYIEAEREQKKLEQEEKEKFEKFLLTLKHRENSSDIKPIMIARTCVEDLVIGLSPKTLANLNSLGLGPPPYKIGKKVFYLIDDLKKWMTRRKIETYE